MPRSPVVVALALFACACFYKPTGALLEETSTGGGTSTTSTTSDVGTTLAPTTTGPDTGPSATTGTTSAATEPGQSEPTGVGVTTEVDATTEVGVTTEVDATTEVGATTEVDATTEVAATSETGETTDGGVEPYGPCQMDDPPCPLDQACLAVSEIDGNFCAPYCAMGMDCPAAPPGVGASGLCALAREMMRPTNCALICNPMLAEQCPAGMSCKPVPRQEIGICTAP